MTWTGGISGRSLHSCVNILCVYSVGFLLRAVLETCKLQSILFMKDWRKTLNWRQSVLLTLATSMYGFKTPYPLYSLFNGDWHEENDNFGDAIFVMGCFSVLFCVRAHDLVNSGNKWHVNTLKWWVLVTQTNLDVTMSGLKTSNYCEFSTDKHGPVFFK